MIPPVIVTIYGNVSVGKSAWAERIGKLAEASEQSVMVNDHHLFIFDKGFQKKLKQVRASIAKQNPDFAVIVIGTGLNESPPFRIEVEHQGFGAFPLFDLFFRGKQ